jgi:hypothetical protein
LTPFNVHLTPNLKPNVTPSMTYSCNRCVMSKASFLSSSSDPTELMVESRLDAYVMTVLLLLLLCVQACFALPESLSSDSEPKRCDWGEHTVIKATPEMSALVLGGTGAVGRFKSAAAAVELVGALLSFELAAILRRAVCLRYNTDKPCTVGT